MVNKAEGKKRIVVYDAVGNDDDLVLDREADETDETYRRRIAFYNQLFRRPQTPPSS